MLAHTKACARARAHTHTHTHTWMCTQVPVRPGHASQRHARLGVLSARGCGGPLESAVQPCTDVRLRCVQCAGVCTKCGRLCGCACASAPLLPTALRPSLAQDSMCWSYNCSSNLCACVHVEQSFTQHRILRHALASVGLVQPHRGKRLASGKQTCFVNGNMYLVHHQTRTRMCVCVCRGPGHP